MGLKITELAELAATPDDTDALVIVDDPAGSPITKKITAVNLLGGVAPKASPTFTGQATIPTINLTGGQIAFPAEAVPSADANTLDDYEEGTYDVTVTCGTSGTVTVKADLNLLLYTKIGRVVHVEGMFHIDSVSSPVGTAIVSLPFTAANLAENASYGLGTVLTSSVTFAGTGFQSIRAESGAAHAYIYTTTSGSAYTTEAADIFSANDIFGFSLTFFI